ncbi:uncharacterized protein METZ01_LOCUS140865, partial [marine metagenome]
LGSCWSTNVTGPPSRTRRWTLKPCLDRDSPGRT